MLDLKRLAEFGVASSGNSFGFATEAQDSGEGGWSGNDPVGSWGREWWGRPLQFLYVQAKVHWLISTSIRLYRSPAPEGSTGPRQVEPLVTCWRMLVSALVLSGIKRSKLCQVILDSWPPEVQTTRIQGPVALGSMPCPLHQASPNRSRIGLLFCNDTRTPPGNGITTDHDKITPFWQKGGQICYKTTSTMKKVTVRSSQVHFYKTNKTEMTVGQKPWCFSHRK